jgi:hypothetical protein
VIGYRKVTKENPRIVAHILEFNPLVFSPKIILGGSSCIGLETVHSMQKRTNAIAAFNGGFYRTGLTLGSNIGMIAIQNKFIHVAEKNRGAIGWNTRSKITLFDQLTSIIQLYLGHYQVHLQGLNEEIRSNQAVLYTHHFARSTLSPVGTKEYLLTPDKKLRFLGTKGNSEIPNDCYILSIPSNGQQIPANLLQTPYYLNIDVSPQINKEKRGIWQKFEYVLQAGPLLVKDHKIVLGKLNEPIPSEIGPSIPRARTAVGIKENGDWVVAIIEATSTSNTKGMNLLDLAQFMKSLSCKDALNLDGGGSSTLVYDGKRFFSSSTIHYPFEHKNVLYMPKEGDRPVGNGIVITN